MRGRGLPRLRNLLLTAVILSVALVFPLCPGARAGAAANEAGYPASVTVPLQFPGLQVMENGDGTQGLLMEGYPSARETGLPALPSRSLPIALPPGMAASGVAVVEEDWYELPGTYTIEWGQPALTSLEDQEPVAPVQANQEVYSSNAAYPEAAVLLKGTSRMRAISIADIKVNPVRYYPQSGIIEVCRSMTIQVASEAGAMPSPEELAASPFDDIVADILDNFEQARPWYEQAVRMDSRALALSAAGDAADYMIITTEALAPGVETLKAYKESQGLSVQVQTVEWISANCSGVDKAEKIRNYLKENYASLGIDYVLLAGYNTFLPLRTCKVETISLTPPFVTVNNIDTDYYYSDLSGDWDLNDDGIYGQPGVDDQAGGVDYYPEVYVGRIPETTPEAMAAICQKVVNFSQDTGAWKHRALLPGAVINYFLEANGILPTYGSSLMEKIKGDILTPLGYTSTTMYETAGLSPDAVPCTLPLSSENVLAEWPNGYGIINMYSHGDTVSVGRKVWTTDNGNGIPEEAEMSWPRFLYNTDTVALDDTHPGVVFSIGCDNAYPWYYNNLMAALLRKGACATVGSSYLSYYTPGWANENMGNSQTLSYMFWKYFLLNGYPIGKALRMADVWMKNNCDWLGGFNRANLYDFNLYGDPSMRLDIWGAPSITGIAPSSAWNIWPVSCAISGCNFHYGAKVKLVMEGQSDIVATNIVVNNSTQIRCTLNVTWAASGKWDVVVENPDGQKVVAEDGFKVTTLCGTGSGTALLALGLALGLLSIAASGKLTRRRMKKRYN